MYEKYKHTKRNGININDSYFIKSDQFTPGANTIWSNILQIAYGSEWKIELQDILPWTKTNPEITNGAVS